MVRKTRPHITQNEALLFEISSPGKKAYQLPDLDVPAVDAEQALGAENVRDGIEGFPEVSEVEAIRHFTRLSTWNYAIDLGMYPLGSCTMKYNPRVNELVARTEGLAWAHPYQPEELAQGAMEVIAVLEAARLDEVVDQVLRSLEFSGLAKYAFGLAQRFNAVYHRYPILNEDRIERKRWRAAGVWYFKTQLTRTLDLMGIEVPARM